MGIKVVKNGLDSFAKKLNNFTDLDSKALNLINDKAMELLRVERASSQFDYLISSMYIGKNTRLISISGDDVAYLEFGIGMVGQLNPYKGNLPQSGVPITRNWQYNYPSVHKITMLQGNVGVTGWFYNKQFHIGYIGEMPLYNTAENLKHYIENDLVKDLISGVQQ